MSRIAFFFAEAVRALRRGAAPSVAAIVTIVVTTLLLGVLVPVLKASSSKTEDIRSEITLRVFLDKNATKHEIDAVERKFDGLRHVTRTEFISKAEALKILRGDVKGNPLEESLKQLPRGNPLPPAFDLHLDNPDNLNAVKAQVAPPGPNGKPEPISPAISSQPFGNTAIAEDISQVTFAVKIVLAVITALLLVASLMLVGNTIRLSIYARRREVEVMRLVGATNWFIRWPFVLEGIIVGVLGAGIAVAILWLGKVTIIDPLSDRWDLVANLPSTNFTVLVIVLVGAAMAISALGSGLTLRRFLRV
jgi:cell division transport system permease protein